MLVCCGFVVVCCLVLLSCCRCWGFALGLCGGWLVVLCFGWLVSCLVLGVCASGDEVLDSCVVSACLFCCVVFFVCVCVFCFFFVFLFSISVVCFACLFIPRSHLEALLPFVCWSFVLLCAQGTSDSPTCGGAPRKHGLLFFCV